MTVIFRHHPVLASILIGGTIAASIGGVARAGDVADAIRTLDNVRLLRERVTFRDLGVLRPVELTSSATSRELYIPVPADVPLIEPSLALKGHYLRADGGRTTYTLSLDGNIVAARSPVDAEGETNIAIGVDGAPRSTGFVRMGLTWSSATGRFYCDDARTIGNALEISPDSWLEYSYDPGDIKDIAGVWSAMSRNVSLLVASDALESSSYDAAWRLGVALERAGKKVQVVALPKQGSVVDVTGIDVPPALASVPAFAALGRGGKVTIGSEAEVGALLLLGSPQFHPDVAVADLALAAGMKAALSAVRNELLQADPDAGAAVEALTAQRDTLRDSVDAKTVNLRMLGGRPVVAVAPDAAPAASGLFDDLWRRTALARRLVVDTARKPESDADRVPLGALDQNASTLDVVGRGDWTTSFDLGSILPRGKIPTNMDIHVAAAPGATATLPVASVFINDYLLGARRLTADGRPERIAVSIPPYALQPRNTVRVEFQRQPASDQCREQPQAFPAAVLPDSVIGLSNAPAPHDFAGLVPQLVGNTVVMAPETWREASTRTLPVVIHVADAASISPAMARFSLLGSKVSVVPTGPFLSFDVPIDGATDLVKVSGQRISIADRKGKIFYDVSGLEQVAVLQAVTNAKQPGISYHTVGDGPQFAEPFRLAQGDVAVLGRAGVLATVNSLGVPLYLNEDGTQGGREEIFTWHLLLDRAFWTHNISWVSTVIVGVAFTLLLLLARRARKRHDDKS